eukprot:TRINITY_DN17214_c0_g1_i1.p1 TRINITY_DN17214_c0_g1~~TRINITY_DN17214_c0_g1_i1.p1  ORF type:complete len:163 (+),score=35.08 TRINITY_DN17214_c0_g1_i1:79-567(+)
MHQSSGMKKLVNPINLPNLVRHAHGTGIHIMFEDKAVNELEHIASESMETVLELACKMSAHRGSKVLQAKDLSFALQSLFGIVIHHPDEKELQEAKQTKQSSSSSPPPSDVSADKRRAPDEIPPTQPLPDGKTAPILKKKKLQLVKKSKVPEQGTKGTAGQP